MSEPGNPNLPSKPGAGADATRTNISRPPGAGGAGGQRQSADKVPRLAGGAHASGGTKIGKYRVVKLLGVGGMGVVYEATDSVLARAVALKVLPPEVSRDDEALKRFVREARLAARLAHPNVVTVYDIARQGDSCYIAMELVRGRSLQNLLETQGALGYREATRVTADACRGLAAAHQAGLIHRDIKPANIFSSSDGSVKLGDFGLAKSLRADNVTLTQKDAVLGTPHYMSPEQCQNETLDARSDIYSLGATYYVLLTGKVPFERDSALKVLYAHCTQPAPDPRALVPALPEGCAQVVLKAMAKSPAERYQTAGEMLADLEAILASGSGASAEAGGRAALMAALENTSPQTPVAMPQLQLGQAGAQGGRPWWSRPAVQVGIGGGAAAVLIVALIAIFHGGSDKDKSVFQAGREGPGAGASDIDPQHLVTVNPPPPDHAPVAIALPHDSALPALSPPATQPMVMAPASQPAESPGQTVRRMVLEHFEVYKSDAAQAAQMNDQMGLSRSVRALAKFYHDHRGASDPAIQSAALEARGLVAEYRPALAAVWLSEAGPPAELAEAPPGTPAASQPATQPAAVKTPVGPDNPPDITILPKYLTTRMEHPTPESMDNPAKDPVMLRLTAFKAYVNKMAAAKDQEHLDAVLWVMIGYSVRIAKAPHAAHHALAAEAKAIVLKYHPEWAPEFDKPVQDGPPGDGPPGNTSQDNSPPNNQGPNGPTPPSGPNQGGSPPSRPRPR